MLSSPPQAPLTVLKAIVSLILRLRACTGNLRVKKLKTLDEQEIAGYLQCLELVFRNYLDISISKSSILKLHHDILIYNEKDESHKVIYKVGSNRVEAKDHTGKVVGVIFDPTPPLFG